MPTCNNCGKSFGNEGAKASHEAHCSSGSGGGQADVQVVDEPTPQQPAPTDGADNELVREMGAQGADAVLKLTGDGSSPDEQKQAIETGLEMAKGAASSLIDRRQKRKEEARKRAQNASLEPAEEFATCPGCGAQFEEIPPGEDTIQCGGCGKVLRVN
mgnify:CR=1 FL=1|jgi:DNA-directed RNA polymerase subunit RPC12/RpoP